MAAAGAVRSVAALTLAMAALLAGSHALAPAAGHGQARKKCPAVSRVQTAAVVAGYNMTKHTGPFFEVYFSDVVEDACTCFSKTRAMSAAPSSHAAAPLAPRRHALAASRHAPRT